MTTAAFAFHNGMEKLNNHNQQNHHNHNNHNNNHNNNHTLKQDHDKPAFSRIFVICGKQHTTDDLRRVFGGVGTIEDIWVVKDKTTKENRGLAYIKYAKMSEACLAIEQMNGKRMGEDDEGPPLKVMN